MNEYDSYLIVNLLQKKLNLSLTDDLNLVDIFVLNTCLVREKASEKVFSQLGKWKKIKEKKQNIIICVGGCLASFNSKDLLAKAPYIDIIFGPQSLHKLPDMIKSYLINKTRLINVSFYGKNEKFSYLPDFGIIKDYSSYITIIEGCNKYCTYCIVPYSRGYENSRTFADILSEVYNYTLNNVKEITFLGQNVNSYIFNDRNNIIDLPLLLSYVNEIEEIKRIRFLSANPIDFDDKLIFCYSLLSKLSSHIHLPLQSGSNNILKLMKRGYTTEFYLSLVNKLRSARTNITFSTDIIVGFPGETENDFLSTLNLIKKVCFDISFVYVYSPRPGTVSYNMKDNICLEEKKNRLKRVNDLLAINAKLISKSMVGMIQRILVYKSISLNSYVGKNDNNRDIVFYSKISYIGEFIKVKIIDFDKSFLIGALI